ncbi:PfkB family carbohydrate kinase [Streptomyces sp. NBC_01241]|uniref:PfkB family carbohydrate kinase n=1 Tax=Streptomyces sp. NBC_01241 TaxID=2903794 RepID=UPI00352D000F|nr:PfkB family carbohydrate kinase [Streptomyces sp. NBC_01241]
MGEDQVSSDSHRQAPRTGFARDVVGIGALNLDYIIPADHRPRGDRQRLSTRIGDLLEPGQAVPEWGTEAAVDEQTVYAALEAADAEVLQTSLGGSAYNALHTLAGLQLDLRLGYIGVAGRVPGPGLTAAQQLSADAIDSRYVFQNPDRLCGVCFSFTEDGERTLLTHPGANTGMGDYLARHFDELVAYLADTHVVHVTSFFDPDTPGRLLALLAEVKRANPATLICVDPGHVWSQKASGAVGGIIALADYLLLNHREFQELGGAHRAIDPSGPPGTADSDGRAPSAPAGDLDEQNAARVLDLLANDRAQLVVKRRSGIHAWQRDGSKSLGDFYPQLVLTDDQIEDDTGAGDVFAAGLLAVMTGERLQTELGCLLGMTLARHKLRYVGSHGHAQLAQVTKDFIRSLDHARQSTAAPEGVFIAHGRNPDWLAVKAFVEQRFGLPVYSFESNSWGSRPVTEALQDYLQRCTFAICVLTAEDTTDEGHRVARQNVIHEIGLFQGRHGFDRVLVLAEDGCATLPETADARTATFPRHAIDKAFWSLDQALRRSGFSRP